MTRFSLPWHCSGASRRLAGLWPHSFGSTALVVCSPAGALCFWEAVSNPERCLTAQLDLSPDDACQQLVCVEPVGFAVLTRLGRVFLVLQPFAGGVLEIRQLTRPASSLLSRVTSLLSYAAGAIGGLVAAADASVVCVAAGVRRGGAERDLFLLTETSLQHWELSTRRPSRLVSERSLNDAVAAYISQSRPSSPAASALLHSERALLDMQVTVGPSGSECAAPRRISFAVAHVRTQGAGASMRACWCHVVIAGHALPAVRRADP